MICFVAIAIPKQPDAIRETTPIAALYPVTLVVIDFGVGVDIRIGVFARDGCGTIGRMRMIEDEEMIW